jgi:iron complex transport system substrate-binding protein
VRLQAPAERIIALYGALNEILDALGLADRIAARTAADRLPPSIVDLPSIGTHMRPNLELILGARPDVVLQMGGRAEAVAVVHKLSDYGVPAAMFRADDFGQLYDVIDRVGVLTGADHRAEALIQAMKTRLDRVRAQTGGGPRPTVFFEVRYPNLLGAAADSMVDAVIKAAGGRNVLTADQKFVRLGEEELLRLDPDLYLIQKGPMNPNPAPVDQRPHYRTLTAVQQGMVFVVDEQKYSRPGPRNADAVEELAQLIGRAAGESSSREGD